MGGVFRLKYNHIRNQPKDTWFYNERDVKELLIYQSDAGKGLKTSHSLFFNSQCS